MRTLRMMALVLACVAAPACDDDAPTAPTANDLTGRWTGTSSYPNAPFELVLTQTGVTFSGEYKDRLDTSLSVTGTYTRPTFAIVIDFGDAKLNLNGTVRTGRRADGTMFTSALGNKMFPFTMTR